MPLDRQATSHDEQARAILRANDRGGYTVPSARLYPFQWNWDSPLTAIGWATFDLDRAWREFETLVTGQWPNGMIPHIVFHAPSDGYYPGPDAWGTRHAPPTSGISQPPVAATCLRDIVERAPDRDVALRRARPLAEKLFAWHRWWHETRDPDATGLVACLHPWETGRDNSPEWDEPLAAVAPRVDVAALRKDLVHADAAQRPTHDYYNRVMTLVAEAKAVDWDGAVCFRASSFRVCDLGIQSILIRADEDLAALCEALDLHEEAARLAAWRAASIAAMARMWRADDAAFQSFDLRAGRPVGRATVATFLPLYAGAVDAVRAESLATLARRTLARCAYGMPSIAPGAPGFDAKRYWRGPVWPFMNRLLAVGFARHGFDDIAGRLRRDTRTLIERHGFREYFDPETGAGLGGDAFSWTAASWLVWAGTRPN